MTDGFGKSIPLMEIVAGSIRFLKYLALEELNIKITEFEWNEITWVITIPAAFSDSAKNFIQKAAEMAGIDQSMLRLAVDDVAVFYCKRLPEESFVVGGESVRKVLNGYSKYLILKVGGSTITYTVVDEQKLRHSKNVNGWKDIGDTNVKKAFEEFLEEIIGNDVFRKFCDQNYNDYLDLCRNLEAKLRIIKPNSSAKVTLKMPNSLLEMAESSNFRDILSRKECRWVGDKLRMKSDDFRNFFEPVCQNIIKCVKQILHESKTQDINTIILVGGLAESPILREAIRQSFQQTIIIPCEPSIAILKGAAIFGHHLIAQEHASSVQRISKLTFGVKVDRVFKQGDSERKKIIVNGKVKCRDCFHKLVERDEELSIDFSTKLHYQLTSDQTKLTIPMYSSLETNPCFIDDPHCSLFANMIVDIPDIGGGKNRQVILDIKFGGVEIEINAINKATGESLKAIMDRLNI